MEGQETRDGRKGYRDKEGLRMGGHPSEREGGSDRRKRERVRIRERLEWERVRVREREIEIASESERRHTCT